MPVPLKPRDQTAWMQSVEDRLRGLIGFNPRQVPIGALVLYPAAAATLPPGWLAADGGTFSADEAVGYPRLAARLGSTTLPNPAAVSGLGWIIRAR